MANIGIDLGTTNSLVAVVLDGSARVLLNDEGQALTPSAVRYHEDGRVEVGAGAMESAVEHAASTITSVKRFMGRSLEESREEASDLHYELADGEDRVVRIQLPHAQVTPVEVSAEILRSLRTSAEECLFGAVSGAVITVPAYFDDAQRQATRDAGRLAGLEVLRLLNEPTAAAIAYGLQEGSEGTYAVFDLGGGTFDISILELSEGLFQVLSTAGDTRLGGDDFDHLLAARLLAELGEEQPSGALRRLAAESARAAKEALSAEEETTLGLRWEEQELSISLSRSEFEEAIRPIVQRALDCCAQALKDAELSLSDVDGVVMVGGSTRVPLVRQMVGEYFGSDPLCHLDPDQVVALGAAIQADLLTGSSELADDLLLLDVVPLSLGIETMGGVVERLILRCSPIPATASETFTTHVDGQTAVDLHVLQGERELASDCRSLGRFKLSGIPPMPAGLPRVKVEFTVDANGILTVSAVEQYTETRAEIEVQPSYGLEEDDIEQMLEDAIDAAEQDVDHRMLIESRVEAEQVVAALRKAIRDDGALLQDGEREKLEGIAAELEASLSEEDRQKIAGLTRKLDETSAPFAQRRIERDLQIALQGQRAQEVAASLQR